MLPPREDSPRLGATEATDNVPQTSDSDSELIPTSAAASPPPDVVKSATSPQPVDSGGIDNGKEEEEEEGGHSDSGSGSHTPVNSSSPVDLLGNNNQAVTEDEGEPESKDDREQQVTSDIKEKESEEEPSVVAEKESVSLPEDSNDETSKPVSIVGHGEVVEILSTLQSLKTPEPHEVDDGIVRASFVDFVIDDPIEEQSDDDDDDCKDLDAQLINDANPNPELQKIREEQVRKWLIFEEENPPQKQYQHELQQDSCGTSGSNTLESLTSIEADSLVDGEGERENRQPGPGGMEGEEEVQDENELMMNGVDGMQRRVRFLTDQDGNLLISVFMTKLVTLFLFFLKLASAGYLDFLSLSAPSPPTLSQPSPLTSTHSSTLHPRNSRGHTQPSSQLSLSSSSTCSSADSFILLLEPPDDERTNRDHTILIPDSTPATPLSEETSILSNGGKEIESQISNNPSLVVSPPSLTEVEDSDHHRPSAPPIEPVENDETDEDNDPPSILLIAPPPLLQNSPSQSEAMQKELNDNEEASNSSDETLSVSSCNSMIEIIPTINPVNDNTLSRSAITVPGTGRDKQESHIISPVVSEETMPIDKYINASLTNPSPENGQNNKAIQDLEDSGSNESSQPDSLIIHELEEHHEGFAVTNGNHPQVAKLPNVDENNNVVDMAAEQVKTNGVSNLDSCQLEPAIPELRRPASSDGEDERMSPPTAHPGHDDFHHTTHHSVINKHVIGDGNLEDQEQQMMSLCIQEEHISAVAVTIAKWESMWKAQSTENLSTIGQAGNGTHAPVTKTSSSPCPKVQKGVLSSVTKAPPTMALPPQPVVVQQALVSNGNTNTNSNNNNKEASSNNKHRNSTDVTTNNAVNAPGEPVVVGKVAGWNCWGNKVKEPASSKSPDQTNGNGSCGDEEIIYAQPNNQAGTTMTSIANPSAILKAYPKPLSKGEIVNWLKEGEIHRAGILLTYGQSHHHAPVVVGPSNVSPLLVNWFFGLISRQQAERYLHGQPPGTFLVRISTRIWGYTLSYQASSQRTKHFLISAINPAVPATLTALTDTNGNNPAMPPQTGKQQRMSPFVPQGRYAFIGTNMTPYGTLVSLIRHHSHAPITKLGGEKLLHACPGGPQVAGLELLFK